MEDYPELFAIEATMKVLEEMENRLTSQLSDESAVEKRRGLVSYMEICKDNLEQRKETLLDDLNQAEERRVNEIRHCLERIGESQKICKKAMALGSACMPHHKDLALSIAKQMEVVKNIKEPSAEFNIHLSPTFTTTIRNYGFVSYGPDALPIHSNMHHSGNNSNNCSSNNIEERIETLELFEHSTNANPNYLRKKFVFENLRNIILGEDSNTLFLSDIGKKAIYMVKIDTGDTKEIIKDVEDVRGIGYDARSDSLLVSLGCCVRIASTDSERITTLAGKFKEQGYTNNTGKQAKLSHPHGIIVDYDSGTYVVADTGNNAIRIITGEGRVSTYAGNTKCGFVDGPALSSQFAEPVSVAYNPHSVAFYVCDKGNNKIREISDGYVSTVCDIEDPTCIAIDDTGRIYVTSRSGNRVYRITKNEMGIYNKEVFAGSGLAGHTNGPTRLQSKFCRPFGIIVCHQFCYVVDNRCRVRKISLD